MDTYSRVWLQRVLSGQNEEKKLFKIQPLPKVLRVQPYVRTLLLVKMKEKKLLKIQSLQKVLHVQAIRATT
jgi:hypothetical protein